MIKIKKMVQKQMDEKPDPILHMPGLEDTPHMLRVRTSLARQAREEAGGGMPELRSAPYHKDWDEFVGTLEKVADKKN